jgi:hypothetical protein
LFSLAVLELWHRAFLNKVHPIEMASALRHIPENDARSATTTSTQPICN